jgi:hypothetical protein
MRKGRLPLQPLHLQELQLLTSKIGTLGGWPRVLDPDSASW